MAQLVGRAHHAGQHHDRRACYDRDGVKAKFDVLAGADRRLPRADRRQLRQHPGRRQGRPEDRGEVAGAIRRRSTSWSRTPTRSPARSARTCAPGCDTLALSRQLATIKHATWTCRNRRRRLRARPAGRRGAARAVRALEFRALLRAARWRAAAQRAGRRRAAGTPAQPAHGGAGRQRPPTGATHYDDHHRRGAARALAGAARAAPSSFAFDTETTSLDYMQARDRRRVVLRRARRTPPTCRWRTTTPARRAQLDRDACWRALKPLLEDPARAKLGQHLKYDMHVLRNHGIALARHALRHHARILRARTAPPRATTWIRWR